MNPIFGEETMKTKIIKLLEKYRDKKFVIYGAGYYGEIVKSRLEECGYDVHCFIDMYSFKSEFFGVPIIRCEEMNKWVDPQKYVVVITIADESEHEWINKILQKYNVGHVIYKHLGIIDSKVENDNYIYEFLTNRNRYNMFKNCGEHYIAQSIDIYRLFKTDGRLLITDLTLLPYFDFFEGRTDMAGEFVLQNSLRYKEANSIYRMLNIIWENGISDKFYPTVKYNKINGHFIVDRNIEVALFQVAKNYSHIKCAVSNFVDLVDDKSLLKQNLSNWLVDNDITHLYTPIPIYGFYNIPSKREMGGITRARELVSWLSRNKISVIGLSVLDAGAYLGFFAQLFSDLGASKIVAIERNSANCSIGKIINNIITSQVEIRHCSIEEIPLCEKYDISILFSVLYWHLDTEIGKKIIEVINEVTSKYLFWESGDKIEGEKQFILENTSFKSYSMISHTYGTGKLRELGVFIK